MVVGEAQAVRDYRVARGEGFALGFKQLFETSV
jgi:hypothetical protein